jgi:hypothetical protein
MKRAVDLLNALKDASEYDLDRRTLHLSLMNVANAIRVAVDKLTVSHHEVAALESSANRLVHTLDSHLEADDAHVSRGVIVPSDQYFLPEDATLKGAKFALLDLVAGALLDNVEEREQTEPRRLRTEELQKVLSTETRSVTKYARESAKLIADEIVRGLLEARYSKLLERPFIINEFFANRDRLATVIGRLIDDAHATVPHVAKAVMFTFGAPASKLKNFFSKALLKEWYARRALRPDPHG